MGAAEARIARVQPADALLLRVRGVVQGVGFRPMVWHVARELGLVGLVCNDGVGVRISAWGPPDALVQLPARLRAQCPPLARIDAIEGLGRPSGAAPGDFRIVASLQGDARTEVAPDVATCAPCLAEVRDPSSRRWRHGFANCTHCGPRYSLLRALPYDRASTGMAGFPMCADCAAEYADPADRRFHAQPIACPACGPRLWLELEGRRVDADPIERAAELLRDGGVVAVKGVGAYHLVARADSPEVVRELRRRKMRPHKPLALIARDLDVVRRYASPTPGEEQALGSPAAPVVLLAARGPERLADEVAPGTDLLGFVLPMSPLHHLLLAPFDSPLVFTSGNAAGRPPCTGEAEAREDLRGIADAWLMHDRPILHRLDDSVQREVGGAMQTLRRGRGLAPEALALPEGFADAPPITALGAQWKNTACLLREGRAVPSQHFGDLGDSAASADAARELQRLSELFGHDPQRVAVDLHPDYESTRRGHAMAAAAGLEVESVQHHHAHVAACMAEHGHSLGAGPVLGLALDGSGLGDDGRIWGGELLRVDYTRAVRVAGLRPTALPGGDAAARQPWRNLAAQLLAAPEAQALLDRYAADEALRCLADKPMALLARMIESSRHAPPASSSGRLFDAVAAALGLVAREQSFEGQAAMALESLAARARDDGAYELGRLTGGQMPYLDPAPLWPQLLADLRRATPAPTVARRFLRGLAAGWARLLRDELARQPYAAVALTGGVFQNALFTELLCRDLRPTGVALWTHRRVPANDGGIALGQAVVAAARALQPEWRN